MKENIIEKKGKRNSHDLILKEAFKLFLQKNVEKVTVPQLERATRLQRGAIFYHFKDKESIFVEVIEKYFFSPLNIFYPINPDKIYSLKEYWDKKNEHQAEIQYWFKQEKISFNPHFAFFHLAQQANLYIPSFKKKMLALISCDKMYWKQVAQLDVLVKNNKLDYNLIGDILSVIYSGRYHFACYGGEQKSFCYTDILETLVQLSNTRGKR